MFSSSNTGTNEESKNGIILGHAYSLLDVYEIQGIRLLKLRNPWGQGDWTGDWCPTSDKWTDDLRAQLKPDTTDTGNFFMTFDDYLAHFSNTSFCVL